MTCINCGYCPLDIGPSGMHIWKSNCPVCKKEYTVKKYATGPDPYLPTKNGPPRPDLFPGIDIPGSPSPVKNKSALRRLLESIFTL